MQTFGYIRYYMHKPTVLHRFDAEKLSYTEYLQTEPACSLQFLISASQMVDLHSLFSLHSSASAVCPTREQRLLKHSLLIHSLSKLHVALTKTALEGMAGRASWVQMASRNCAAGPWYFWTNNAKGCSQASNDHDDQHGPAQHASSC